MSGIVKTILDMLQKSGYFVLEYGQVSYSYILKFVKQRIQNWKKCSLRKGVAKAEAGLGSEIYSLYKQGQMNWTDLPTVKNHLQQVEEAESLLLRMDEALEEIERNHQARKETIRERYSAKRAGIGTDES